MAPTHAVARGQAQCDQISVPMAFPAPFWRLLPLRRLGSPFYRGSSLPGRAFPEAAWGTTVSDRTNPQRGVPGWRTHSLSRMPSKRSLATAARAAR